MNNVQENVEAGGKVFIKDLVRLMPLCCTTVEIFDDLQSSR